MHLRDYRCFDRTNLNRTNRFKDMGVNERTSNFFIGCQMNDAWILFEWWSSSVLLWWISWFPEGSSGALSDFTFWIRTLVNGVSSTMWLFVVISYSDNAITRLPRSSWLSWYTRYKLVLTSASLKTSNCFVPGILFWPLSAQVYLRQVEFFLWKLERTVKRINSYLF